MIWLVRANQKFDRAVSTAPLPGIGSGRMTSNAESRSVVFHAEGNELRVNATGAEAGDGSLVIAAETEGGEVKAHFNSAYVLEALRVLQKDRVTFQFRWLDSESDGLLPLSGCLEAQ